MPLGGSRRCARRGRTARVSEGTACSRTCVRRRSPSRCRTATFTRPRSVRRPPPRCCAPAIWPIAVNRIPRSQWISRRVGCGWPLVACSRVSERGTARRDPRLPLRARPSRSPSALILDRFIRAASRIARSDPLTEAEARARRCRSRTREIWRTRSDYWSSSWGIARCGSRTKNQLRAALAAAQADLTAAAAAARRAATARARQAELQELLDGPPPGHLASRPGRLAATRFRGGDDAGDARPLEHAGARGADVGRIVDSANGQAAARLRTCYTLNAQLSTANPEISRLEQAITELQPSSKRRAPPLPPPAHAPKTARPGA